MIGEVTQIEDLRRGHYPGAGLKQGGPTRGIAAGGKINKDKENPS